MEPASYRTAARSPSTRCRRRRQWPRTAPAGRGWRAEAPTPRRRFGPLPGDHHRYRGRSPGAGRRPRPATVTGPEVVAHRGSTTGGPEHTLAAYRHAAEVGADAVECDVRMTRHGVLVCVHDRRIRHTSNGRGVVSALQLEELERFQFGPRRGGLRNRWAGDVITAVTDEPDVENGLVLTLDRLLGDLTPRPGTVRLAIETKHPTRHAGKVEEALVEL